VTEGNGHVIDPNGDARRALQEAVAEHGPEVLSNAAVIGNVCRDHLAGLPGESILIGDAARTNVPALLSELIPRLGNYGAIQSAAAALAGEHNLDMAASLWVVREFARALGYIAPATGTSAAFPGSGPRPVASSGPRPVSGSGPAAGAGPAEMGGATGAGEGSGTARAGGEEGREEGGSARPGGGETGSAVAGGAAAAAAGVAADEASRGESAGGEIPGSGDSASGAIDSGSPGGRGTGGGSVASGGERGYGTGPAGGATGQAPGRPESTGPAPGRPGTTGPAPGRPGSTGPATGPVGTRPGTSQAGGGGSGGGAGRAGGAGGAAPEGEPGFPLPLPAGRLPGRQPEQSKVLNRNTVGIAAAIALIAGYLGVAAVAHLSPFPAKTVARPSASQSLSPPSSTSSSPGSSTDASAPPPSPSQFEILLTKIPGAVKDQNGCKNIGTGFGATAVSQCQQLRGLGAGTILYYLYPNRTALASGFSGFLKTAKFSKRKECTTNGNFSDFLVECESDFTIKTPGMTGSIAEYVNSSRDQNPIIVSTDNEQNVMVIMVGTDDRDLLAYWNKLEWVVTP
jgi:hypothetical protein